MIEQADPVPWRQLPLHSWTIALLVADEQMNPTVLFRECAIERASEREALCEWRAKGTDRELHPMVSLPTGSAARSKLEGVSSVSGWRRAGRAEAERSKATLLGKKRACQPTSQSVGRSDTKTIRGSIRGSRLMQDTMLREPRCRGA